MTTKKTDGGTIHKHVLIRCKIKNWQRRLKNRADWEKSIKKVKVRIGLQYCLRRRRRRRFETCSFAVETKDFFPKNTFFWGGTVFFERKNVCMLLFCVVIMVTNKINLLAPELFFKF